MTQFKLLGSTALVALISANAAFADVTPEEVWENWKAMRTAQGQTITSASEERDGDDLVVTDVVLAVDDGSGTKFDVSVPEITLSDLGDGTVEITSSDEFPIVITTPGMESGESVVVTLTMSAPEASTIASGTPDETRYDFDAPEVNLTLTDLQSPDTNGATMDFDLTITAAAGNYIVTGTDQESISSSFTADSIDYTFNGKDGDKGFDFKGGFASLAGTSTGKIAGDMKDIAAALKAGFATQGNVNYGESTLQGSVTDPQGTMNINTGAQSGDFTFDMSADGIAYGGNVKDAMLTLSGSQIPFPEVKLAYTQGAFNIKMPVMAADTPSDFALVTKLVDLTISDDVWGMFDPTNQLPRDPMTVALDVSGQARLTSDLFDATAMQDLDAAPGDLNSLKINELQVKLAGADLTGTGDLTFDNSDKVTYGGAPVPTGKINLQAVGVNGLMDKLVAMGLLPEDQVMGARMMLGMFAKPVEGAEDTIASELEFKNKGFFANGMQLQ